LPTSKGLPSSLVQLRTAVWTGVTRDTMPTPTLSVSSVASATKGEVINLSSVVTTADPGGLPNAGAVGFERHGGWRAVRRQNAPQTGGHEIDVSPTNVANTVFGRGHHGRHRYTVGAASSLTAW
jgi:hypothetical protein